MTQAEEIAALRDQVKDLQRQIVELRMRMEQQAEAQAALIEHAVSRAVDAKTGGRTIDLAQWEWIRDGAQAAADRKKARNQIVLHIAQWGVGLTIAFVAVSVLDSVKAKLGMKP